MAAKIMLGAFLANFHLPVICCYSLLLFSSPPPHSQTATNEKKKRIAQQNNRFEDETRRDVEAEKFIDLISKS